MCGRQKIVRHDEDVNVNYVFKITGFFLFVLFYTSAVRLDGPSAREATQKNISVV